MTSPRLPTDNSDSNNNTDEANATNIYERYYLHDQFVKIMAMSGGSMCSTTNQVNTRSVESSTVMLGQRTFEEKNNNTLDLASNEETASTKRCRSEDSILQERVGNTTTDGDWPPNVRQNDIRSYPNTGGEDFKLFSNFAVPVPPPGPCLGSTQLVDEIIPPQKKVRTEAALDPLKCLDVLSRNPRSNYMSGRQVPELGQGVPMKTMMVSPRSPNLVTMPPMMPFLSPRSSPSMPFYGYMDPRLGPLSGISPYSPFGMSPSELASLTYGRPFIPYIPGIPGPQMFHIPNVSIGPIRHPHFPYLPFHPMHHQVPLEQPLDLSSPTRTEVSSLPTTPESTSKQFPPSNVETETKKKRRSTPRSKGDLARSLEARSKNSDQRSFYLNVSSSLDGAASNIPDSSKENAALFIQSCYERWNHKEKGNLWTPPVQTLTDKEQKENKKAIRPTSLSLKPGTFTEKQNQIDMSAIALPITTTESPHTRISNADIFF